MNSCSAKSAGSGSAPPIPTSPCIDLARLAALLPRATEDYRRADPFPHVVLDDFLPPEVSHRLARDFPPLEPAAWINYVHVNERKYGCTDWSRFPPSLADAIAEMNSPRFVRWLELLTGLEGLLADPGLEGGGLHQSTRGGHLNVHADFTGHPHRPTWRRRINLLLYLNEGWQEDWGGQLELWSRDMRRCVRRIAPLHNRAVIFSTDTDSFHGHPEPLVCPDTVTRKSIALYYFTAEPEPFLVRSTEYRARPDDGVPTAVGIYLDKMVLRTYDRVKRAFGLDDRFTSRLLRGFSRLRRR